MCILDKFDNVIRRTVILILSVLCRWHVGLSSIPKYVHVGTQPWALNGRCPSPFSEDRVPSCHLWTGSTPDGTTKKYLFIKRRRVLMQVIINPWSRKIGSWTGAIDVTYHGYAMRKIQPLCIKTVTCKSKGFLCLFGHNNRIHCFCLKNLNLFSQNITFRVINYLNLVEKIIWNWNVDEVSVPIISKDIS